MAKKTHQKTPSRKVKVNYTGKPYPCFSKHKPLELQTDLDHMSHDLWNSPLHYLRIAFAIRKKQKNYLASITPVLSSDELSNDERLRHELSRRYNQLVQRQRYNIDPVHPDEFRKLFAEAEDYWPINFHIVRKLAPYYPKK